MNFDGAISSVDNTITGLMSYIDENEYVSAFLTLFLILYAGLAAPKLPKYIAELFGYPLFRLLIFFLIVYSANKNVRVALLVAIGFAISMHTLNKYELDDQLFNFLQMRENMEAELIEEDGEPEGEMQIEEVAETDSGIPVDISEQELEEVSEGPACKSLKFRNSFYPQYVNMKPDTYNARYTGNAVGGYDADACYAGSQNRRTSYGSNRGHYNGARGAYN